MTQALKAIFIIANNNKSKNQTQQKLSFHEDDHLFIGNTPDQLPPQ